MKLIARRYAKAIFELAEDKQVLRQDVEALIALFESDMNLLEELGSVLLTPANRKQLFKELTQNLNLNNIWYNTLLLLAEKKRVNLLNDVCLALQQMLLNFSNEIKVKISVAKQKTPEELEKIISLIESKLNKKVIAEIIIDESILGGFEASGESLHIDGSVRYNLEKFKAAFSS